MLTTEPHDQFELAEAQRTWFGKAFCLAQHLPAESDFIFYGIFDIFDGHIWWAGILPHPAAS